MKILFLILTFGLFLTINAHSQPSPKDTTIFYIPQSELDSTLDVSEDLVHDSILSNDEALYKNIWNVSQIKYPLNTLPPKDELITINLMGQADHAFVLPVKGQILSRFGKRGRRMHTGIDIRLNSGDTVRCAFDGKVRLAKRYSGYGNLVLVRHNNGLETIYGHLKAIKVKVNDTIKAGDLIGLGGRTGRATCNHLHFETRVFGLPFNSNKYIDFETGTLRTDKIYYKDKRFEADPENFNQPAAPENARLLAGKSTGRNTSKRAAARGSRVDLASKHVIRKGENLGSIARRYHTTIEKLCTVNNITAQKTLKIGSVLRLN